MLSPLYRIAQSAERIALLELLGFIEFIGFVGFIEFKNLLISSSLLPRVTLSPYLPICLFRFRIPQSAFRIAGRGGFSLPTFKGD